jgi:para-aminobenzoate synthetase component 1/para-aminobenzoate synthetase/4-amino-4-deoxychorismate lyase
VNFQIDFPDPRDAAAPRLRHGFGTPLRQLAAHGLDQVRGVLDAVQQAARAGQWCLGWVRYEAAPAFDPAFADAVHASPAGRPLAWFAVFDGPQAWPEDPGAPVPQVQWAPGLDRMRFDAAIARVHQAIAAGDCYQVNYTAQFEGRMRGDAAALFAALRQTQPGGYVARMDCGDEQVLSVSPELFFDWDGEHLLTRPMKGTAPRGATPDEDQARVHAMRSSPKERAENVMIVDLLRNDVSRIARPHSVRVPRLFHAEPLPTVWQMTSDVEARTRAGVGLSDVFGALFPCGSITGAPKRQAMRLIRELEAGPRGIYCGALGVVRPGAVPGRVHATFNVPIRTVVARGAALRCGIGSGITAGAEAAAEWQEWQHKRAFLDRI